MSTGEFLRSQQLLVTWVAVTDSNLRCWWRAWTKAESAQKLGDAGVQNCRQPVRKHQGFGIEVQNYARAKRSDIASASLISYLQEGDVDLVATPHARGSTRKDRVGRATSGLCLCAVGLELSNLSVSQWVEAATQEKGAVSYSGFAWELSRWHCQNLLYPAKTIDLAPAACKQQLGVLTSS